MTKNTGKTGLGRRDFLKGAALASAGAGAGLTVAAGATPALAAVAGPLSRAADLPKPSGQRVIVVGGGWSGLTMAKYLKKNNPKFDVVMIEPNSTFFSCPLSNLWLGDVVDLDLLLHSYTDAAKNNGYAWLQGMLVQLDREKRRAFTTAGYIDYDYIVLSPGIDYNYASLGVKDPAEAIRVAQTWPAGFKPGSEHLSIKAKLDDFEEGVFLLNVPTGNYRCLPGPYERACLIASYFKREGIKGKVVLLDPNEKPTIKADGFLAAFKELHKDHLEYRTAATITGVDVDKKKVITEFGEVEFADAALYPRVRAARIIQDLGLADPKSPQMEGKIDNFKYTVPGDDHTYIAGDARPMPFSKSGNTANTEAHIVSKMIAARAQGKDSPWESPNTICYSMVDGEGKQSIMVDAKYKFTKGKGWGFTDVKLIEKRSKQLGKANIEWGKGLYRDMFS